MLHAPVLDFFVPLIFLFLPFTACSIDMWWIRKPIFRVLLGLSPIVFSLDPDPGLILNLPTAGENWTFPENSSTTSDNSLGAVNGSLSEIPRYACLGRQYGPDLDIGDCREAANTMIETLPTQMGRSVRFGNGHGGPYDVNLPYKSIACKLLT